MSTTNTETISKPGIVARIRGLFRGDGKKAVDATGEPPRISESEFRAAVMRLTLKDARFVLTEQSGEHFRALGQEHGSKGMPRLVKEIQQRAEGAAHIVNAALRSFFLIHMAQETGRSAETAKRLADANEREQETRTRKVAIDKMYDRDPAQFSLGKAVFYLVVSAVFILADVPFSWQLTAKGFIFEVEKDFWEIAFVSVGIALTAFYFKIFYDTYMAHGIDKAVLNFRPASLPKVDPEDMGARNRIYTAWGLKLAFNVATVVLAIYALYALGNYRHQVLLAERAEEYLVKYMQDRMVQDLEDPAVKPLIPNTHFLRLLQTPAAREVLVVMTIVFPVIGGILLSIGTRVLTNARNRRAARKEHDAACAHRAQCEGKDAEQRQQAEAVREAMEADEKGAEEHLHHLRNQFVARYNEAHASALWSRTNDTDTFTQARKHFHGMHISGPDAYSLNGHSRPAIPTTTPV